MFILLYGFSMTLGGQSDSFCKLGSSKFTTSLETSSLAEHILKFSFHRDARDKNLYNALSNTSILCFSVKRFFKARLQHYSSTFFISHVASW